MTGDILERRPARRIAIYGAVFFAVTSLTIALTRYGGGLAMVWPGSGIVAAMLLTLPRDYWPRALAVVAILSALATSLFGFGPALAGPLAVVNVLEAWLIARLMLFARPKHDWFDNVGALGAFVLTGGIVAPALAAIPGGFAAYMVAPGGLAHHFTGWLAAHGLGTVLVLPLAYLLSARERSAPGLSRRETVELAAHCVLIGVVAELSINQSDFPLLFLPIMPVLFAAFRLGRHGAALGSVIVAAITLRAFHLHVSPIDAFPVGESGKLLFLQFYLVTISLLAIPVSVLLRQQRLLLAELEERKALKRLIADHSDDALLNLDERGHIRYASPAGERLSGVSELVGRPLTLFFDPLDELLVRGALSRAAMAPGDTVTLERSMLRGEDQLWLEAKIRAVAPDGTPASLHGFAVTIRDVTTRKHAELDAIHSAETDALTGLPNRRALLRRLETSLAHADRRPFALAIIDLDHFKAINDTHGHLVGDAVLNAVARVMRRLSGHSRFFARLGGEEFAVLCTQSDFADSVAVCEEVRAAIAALTVEGPAGERLHVTASAGLARISSPCTTVEALQAADALLYAAKDGGRNRVEAAAMAPGERRSIRAA